MGMDRVIRAFYGDSIRLPDLSQMLLSHAGQGIALNYVIGISAGLQQRSVTQCLRSNQVTSTVSPPVICRKKSGLRGTPVASVPAAG